MKQIIAIFVEIDPDDMSRREYFGMAGVRTLPQTEAAAECALREAGFVFITAKLRGEPSLEDLDAWRGQLREWQEREN